MVHKTFKRPRGQVVSAINQAGASRTRTAEAQRAENDQLNYAAIRAKDAATRATIGYQTAPSIIQVNK